MSGARPDTWMPLYWGDYRADTSHLSAAQHGAYLLLIGHYWTQGKPLIDDDGQLARISAMTAREWRKHRPTIAAFFAIETGLWRHRRIDRELNTANAGYARRAKAANARWNKQAQTDNANADQKPPYALSNADAMHDAMHVQPQPEAIKLRDTKTLIRDSVPRGGAASEAERAERKRRWEGRIFDELVRAHGPTDALRFQEAYQRGEPDAKHLYEATDQSLKASRARQAS